MGSYMIWRVEFKDRQSKDRFEKFLKKECIKFRLVHSHLLGNDFLMADFIYDVGYLGYAEADYQKNKLKELGVRKLEQSSLCDKGTYEVIIK